MFKYEADRIYSTLVDPSYKEGQDRYNNEWIEKDPFIQEAEEGFALLNANSSSWEQCLFPAEVKLESINIRQGCKTSVNINLRYYFSSADISLELEEGEGFVCPNLLLMKKENFDNLIEVIKTLL